MRRCAGCGKKGLFLKLDTQKHCTHCSIIWLETKVATIARQVITVENKVTAVEETVKGLEQKSVDIEKSIIDLRHQMNTVKLELANIKEINNSFTVREGDVETLVSEFIQMDNQGLINFKVISLENPDGLVENNILAVHYADGGAQGEAGAVAILYRSQHGIQILYGNYIYGNLNLDAVIRKLPMLKCLDSRGKRTPPYPVGGSLDIPEGWKYMYMGAMNHFFVRDTARDTGTFINLLLNRGGQSWQVFHAVAWFYGALCN